VALGLKKNPRAGLGLFEFRRQVTHFDDGHKAISIQQQTNKSQLPNRGIVMGKELVQ